MLTIDIIEAAVCFIENVLLWYSVYHQHKMFKHLHHKRDNIKRILKNPTNPFAQEQLDTLSDYIVTESNISLPDQYLHLDFTILFLFILSLAKYFFAEPLQDCYSLSITIVTITAMLRGLYAIGIQEKTLAHKYDLALATLSKKIN